MAPIRVLLADDHAMVLDGLASILEEHTDIDVIARASGGQAALKLSEDLEPDVLVIDYDMPDLDGAAVTSRLKAAGNPVKVVFLTMYDNIHYAQQALKAGGMGFVIKSGHVDELTEAIRTVNSGGSYIARSVSNQLDLQQRRIGEPSGVEKLSQREFELLRHLGQGHTLQQAAHAMNVSESTASTYRHRLMSKLSLKNTAQIIRFAIQNEIV